MILWVWVRNDETGVLDDEFRDGDILQTAPDSFEPSIGAQEKKSWLIVKIPDPPLYEKFETDMVSSEYQPGATLGDAPVVRRKRKYAIEWRSKFTALETATIEDSNAMLPDGQLLSGGTVTSGVVSGKFTYKDFRRK